FDPLPPACGPTDDVHGPPPSLCQAGKGLLEDADSARGRSATDERQSVSTRRAQNLAAQSTKGRDITNSTSRQACKELLPSPAPHQKLMRKHRKRFGERWTSHGRWGRRGSHAEAQKRETNSGVASLSGRPATGINPLRWVA